MSDHFSSFKEGSQLRRVKDQLQIKFELLSPYVHQPNLAENAIKRLGNKTIILLQGLADKTLAGRKISIDRWIRGGAAETELSPPL